MRTTMILTALLLAQATTACTEEPASALPPPVVGTAVALVGQGPRVEISVTSEGFVPAQIKAKAGTPLTLVVTRKTDKTCATEIVIKEFNINKPLPLNDTVTVELTPTQPGSIRFACAMDMIAGVINVE